MRGQANALLQAQQPLSYDELRLQLEQQKQQLKLQVETLKQQEEALNQLQAAAPFVYPDRAVASGLANDSNMTRSLSRRKHTLESMSQSPTSMDSLTSQQATTQAQRARKISFGNMPRPTMATFYQNSSFLSQPSDQYASSCSSDPNSQDNSFTTWSPDAFISKNSDSASSYSSSSKRQRTGSNTFTRPIAIQSAFRQTSRARRQSEMLSPDDTVSPSQLGSSYLSPSTMSSQSAYNGMSRQSSTAGSFAIADGINMLRMQSVTSYATSQPELDNCPEQFLIDDLDQPPTATVTAVPSMLFTAPTWSSSSTDTAQIVIEPVVGLSATTKEDVLNQIGTFESNSTEQALLKQDHGLIFSNGVTALESADMVRTSSNMSNGSNVSTSSAAERRAAERHQRHVRNGKQAIESKDVLLGKASISEASTAKSAKQAISKVPYQRPKQQKKFCDLCNEKPSGYHGIHELRRHQARAHSLEGSAWIVTQPEHDCDRAPVRPLHTCKHCMEQKKYNAYYNAAAHIRRSHFHPRKRGRRPKGEPQERRAGMTGGNDPSIAWLKENGWLKEILVTKGEWSTLQAEPDEGDDRDEDVFDEEDEQSFDFNSLEDFGMIDKTQSVGSSELENMFFTQQQHQQQQSQLGEFGMANQHYWPHSDFDTSLQEDSFLLEE